MKLVRISSRLLSPILLAGVLTGAGLAQADSPIGPSATGVRPSAAPAGSRAPIKRGVVSTAKTDLGLSIDYAWDALEVGSTAELRLTVAGNTTGRALSVEIRAGDGLKLATGLPGGRTVQTAASAEHRVAIVPLREGMHYLHLFVQAGDRSEALAIALPVGKNPVSGKAVSPQMMPDGRRVRAIPAQP
jgi:hypothetical protein